MIESCSSFHQAGSYQLRACRSGGAGLGGAGGQLAGVGVIVL